MQSTIFRGTVSCGSLKANQHYIPEDSTLHNHRCQNINPKRKKHIRLVNYIAIFRFSDFAKKFHILKRCYTQCSRLPYDVAVLLAFASTFLMT
jgi:hypothetical protein